MFYASNMGNIKLSDFNGGNGYSAVIPWHANVSLNRKVTVASDSFSSKQICFW
jgi:hypothetical protein